MNDDSSPVALVSYSFGDGDIFRTPECAAQTGGATAGAEVPANESFRHTYERSGVFEATFVFASGVCDPSDPHRDVEDGSILVEVAPPDGVPDDASVRVVPDERRSAVGGG